jgi:hypothetical protein
MYTPHQYGIASLSNNDKYSINWLYRLQAGMPVKQFAAQHGLTTTSDLDAVIRKIDEKNNPDTQHNTGIQISTHRDLLEEASNIGDLKKYKMLLQNISISPQVNKYLKNKNAKG